MSTTATKRMLSAYFQDIDPTLFLTSLFQLRPENIYESESVEIDIKRQTEKIAIAVQDLSVGGRWNSLDLSTNKEFKPPVYKEQFVLNAFDLIKRMPGQNPFENPVFLANLTTKFFDGMKAVSNKINRSIELQASQVLQTGVVTLNDAAGNAVYSIDYKPKSSHLPTAGNAWGGAGATPIADLTALGEEIRTDGLQNPDQTIFGVDAFEALMGDEEFRSRMDTRRVDLGQIASMAVPGNGGNYRGTLDLGNFKVDVWTYAGRYEDPTDDTNVIQFVDPSKVIMRASAGRLDATYGAIPNIASLLGMGRGLIPGLPSRFSNASAGVDLSTHAWISANGEQAFGQAGSRPLLIPTAIDTFGCLETNA